MRASLIIAAGGSGSRFQQTLQGDLQEKGMSSASKGPLSKLFYSLAGKPLLAHTVQAFQRDSRIKETLIAAPVDSWPVLRAMVRRFEWRGVKIVSGGATRAESVYRALVKSSPSNEWVLVHDGARPFVTLNALEKLWVAAKKFDAVILGKKVVPTIKEISQDGQILKTIDRSYLCEAETPQMIRRSSLLQAYRQVSNAFAATDEASLMEQIGMRVHMMTHDGWNPKITTYKDFELAEAFLTQESSIRTGFGRDTHRLVEKRKLLLGGVHVPFAKGPLGHSDGDALLHAVTDAILGAIGAGDIGDWFSDKNPKYKNMPSSKLLRAVLDDAAMTGVHIVHVDTVVILEKPKLGIYKARIRENLAKILDLSPGAVSVKAKTAEGLGPEGQGLSITCEAVVTVKKSH